MSDEHILDPRDYEGLNKESGAQQEHEEDAYELIDEAEVDRVVAALTQLMETVESETIRDYIEATCSDIACLVEDLDEYEIDDADEGPSAQAA